MKTSDQANPTEQRRLKTLADLAVLDTLPEPVFDAIAAAAARTCGVPIALLSLVGADRQWFKSNIGLPGVEETSRDVAFCDHAIREDTLFEVPNALEDTRFATNPLVTGDPSIRFYAGAPIVMPGGARIGTVCVIDRMPRQLTQVQREMLEGLGRIAAQALLDRQRQIKVTQELALSEARYRAIVEDQSELISLAGVDGTLTFVNTAYARHYGAAVDRMLGRNLLDFVNASDRDAVAAHWRAVCSGGEVTQGLNRTQSADGATRWVSWTNRPIHDASGQVSMVQSVGRDVTDQQVAEAALRHAIRDKETLLKEVYHRVKNNLQIVQSLLNLQQRSTADASARSVLAESVRRIRAMALVHEKLYQSGDLAAVSLRDYTQELLRQIDDAAGGPARAIRLVATIADRQSGLDGAIPFGLLVTELVFNALEHGFGDRQSGLVRVDLAWRGDTAWLTVSDNGVGLQPGFNLGSTGSMGLQLAASLALQLGGELKAHNEEGAVFTAALPRL